MKMPMVCPSLLQLIIVSSLFYLAYSAWENLRKGSYGQKSKSGKEQKFYFYNDIGNLIINGIVPGSSPPIVLDHKKYYPSCTTNVYYTFIFRANISLSANNICRQGMTICYDGQMIGPHLRPEYNISNVDMPEVRALLQKCKDAANANLPETNEYEKSLRKNLPAPTIRYLNVALKRVKNLKAGDIQTSAGEFLPKNKNNGNVWHFFEISASFTKEKYYFVSPEDGNLIIQIGDQKKFSIKLTDSDEKEIPPVTFTYKGKKYGVDNLGGPSPDMNNGGNLRHHVGLWMFYLDFKTNYRTWQTLSTIHPNNGECKMQLEIRSNRMRPCRSYFEDIAILEPADTKITMTYTSETGTIRTQKDLKATEKRWKKEQMQMSTTRDNTVDTHELKESEDEEKKEIKENTKTVETKHINKGEFNIGLDIPIPEVGGITLDGGYSFDKETSEFTSETKINEKSTKIGKTTNNFGGATRANAMMESFKSTSGAAEMMSQAEFLSTSNAFTNRETVDVRVTLPPNRKVIIRQLMFDCDGNLVKLPFIVYTDGEEDLHLNDDMAGAKRSRPTMWQNATSGCDPLFECENLPTPNNGTAIINKKDTNRDQIDMLNEYQAEHED